MWGVSHWNITALFADAITPLYNLDKKEPEVKSDISTLKNGGKVTCSGFGQFLAAMKGLNG